MSKCYICIDFASQFDVADYASIVKQWVRDESADVPSLKPLLDVFEDVPSSHITLQYCGEEISDADVKVLLGVWRKTLSKAFADAGAAATTEFRVTNDVDVFGKEGTCVVLKLDVDRWLPTAVEEARAEARRQLPHIPESDFPFQNPHLSLLYFDLEKLSDADREAYVAEGWSALCTRAPALERALERADFPRVLTWDKVTASGDDADGNYCSRGTFSVRDK